MTAPDGRARRPVIAIMLPMVWSVRNVIHAGVLQRLADAGAAVHLLFRRQPAGTADLPEAVLSAAAGVHPLIAVQGKSGHGKSLADGLVKSAFCQRHAGASYSIYRRWFSARQGALLRVRAGVIDAVGSMVGTGSAFRRLSALPEWMYRSSHQLEPVRAQLREIAPDLLWSTVSVAAAEYPYALVAQELGLPTISSILSFDNLTSRGLLPRFGRYLVWSDGMRADLLRMYPAVSPDSVEVTGTPQFDFHRRPESRWPRERTLEALGLPAGARYLAYAVSHKSLTPGEPRLVAQLAARMAASPALSGHRLVVRMHPLDDWSRWEPVRQVPSVVLSPAWDVPPDAEGWAFGTVADQARLVSTFAHADVCLNIASTATLDAAILDRPVVGIDFRAEPDCPRDILYEEYDADHYRPLVEAGGLRVAHGWDELEALLASAVQDPGRDAERRRAMVERECGAVDGHAADRVVASVLHAAQRGAGRRVPAPPREVVVA